MVWLIRRTQLTANEENNLHVVHSFIFLVVFV